jgi:hypothetical protein
MGWDVADSGCFIPVCWERPFDCANESVVNAAKNVSAITRRSRIRPPVLNFFQHYPFQFQSRKASQEERRRERPSFQLSRLRRAEIDIHHHIAGAYLLRYAQESSWREDNRRVSNGDQVSRVAALAMKRGKSVDFTGYWQRHIAE